MAFARPSMRPGRVEQLQPGVSYMQAPMMQQAPPSIGPKVATRKDLKKFQKQFDEKISKTMELKGDLTTVHERLRSLGKAFDTLSQIMVDEMDTLGSDMSKNKTDTAEQFSTLARAMQSLPSEIAIVRNATEKCKANTEVAISTAQRLKRWTESGFKRLSEAMGVQQEALTLLDTQIATMTKRLEEARTDTSAARQESAESVVHHEKLRHHLTEVIANHEIMMRECKEQMRQMQSAVSNYDMALSDRETWSGMQISDISRIETQVHELRASFETRIAAIERSFKSSSSLAANKTVSASERRISELESELTTARKQLSEQDGRIRELQLEVQRCSERCLFSSASDRQELNDVVSRAVHDLLRRNPPPALRHAHPPDPDASSSFSQYYQQPQHPQQHQSNAWFRGSPGSNTSVPAAAARHDTSPLRYGSPARRGGGGVGYTGVAASGGGYVGGGGGGYAAAAGHPGGGGYAGESSALGPAGSTVRPFSGGLERVMEEKQRRMGGMREESEERHRALSKAVEEIDSRIRASIQ